MRLTDGELMVLTEWHKEKLENTEKQPFPMLSVTIRIGGTDSHKNPRIIDSDMQKIYTVQCAVRTCSPRGKAAMPGQKMSEKWWRRTRRLRSRVGAISFRRSYSRGTCNATHQRGN